MEVFNMDKQQNKEYVFYNGYLLVHTDGSPVKEDIEVRISFLTEFNLPEQAITLAKYITFEGANIILEDRTVFIPKNRILLLIIENKKV
jgi:hypothetical protein